MPPNARDADNISQEQEPQDSTQEASNLIQPSNAQGNVPNNNHLQQQNGINLPQASYVSGTEQSITYLPSVRCVNVSTNISDRNEVSTRLEDNNTTIYIIPNCDAPSNATFTYAAENQIEHNGNTASVQQQMFLLPSVPHPSNLSISQPYQSYNESAPPDYFSTTTSFAPTASTQQRHYTAAPYVDPPPEYDSWSREPLSIREVDRERGNDVQQRSLRLPEYQVSHPFQTLSYADDCEEQNIIRRPASAVSASTLCRTNNANTSERHRNISIGCSHQAHCRNGCGVCTYPFDPQTGQRSRYGSDQVFNISGSSRCGQSCHYQFPIQTDLSQSGSTNEEQEGGDDEEYDRMTSTPSSPPEYLTIKRWVMVVLLLLLLTTFSLLLGVSMQHFQLLKKFVSIKNHNDEHDDGTYSRYHPKFSGKSNHRYSVPTRPAKTESTTNTYLLGQTSTEISRNELKMISNEKRKRHISRMKSGIRNCNQIIHDPTLEYINLRLSKLQSSNTANSKLLEALCETTIKFDDSKKNNNAKELAFTTKSNDEEFVASMDVCSELHRFMQTNTTININAHIILKDLESQNCLPFNDEIETFSSMQHQDVAVSHGINCNKYSNKWQDSEIALSNKNLYKKMLMYSFVLLSKTCSNSKHSKINQNNEGFGDLDNTNRSSKRLP